MTFDEILDQALEQRQRRGRLTYRALQRQCNLDEAYLADLTAEIIQGQRLAVDEDGAVLVWTGDTASAPASAKVEPATGHYRQALALAEALGMRPLQAHYHRGLGSLYARQGQQDQARTAFSTAIALYRSMDMRFWVPQAEEALREVGGTGLLEDRIN
jgi:Flp pilus assembly protein TadD